MPSRLPGIITGDFEGDLAIVVLVAALFLLSRLFSRKISNTQRLGAFSVGIGLLSVALAFYIDSQRTLSYLNAPVDYARAGEGQSIYQQNCMHCHGVDGKGEADMMGKRPPDLTQRIFQRDESSLAQTIAMGRGAMPGFGDRLLKSQIGDVIQYLRILGYKQRK